MNLHPDKSTPWLLGLTATLVLAIGGALLLAPHAMHRGNGVDLGSHASLLSEIRAPAGALVAFGFLMLGATLRRTWRLLALRAGGLLLLSYGLARLVSIALDGWPSIVLVAAMVVELLAGAALLLAARRTDFVQRDRGASTVEDASPTENPS